MKKMTFLCAMMALAIFASAAFAQDTMGNSGGNMKSDNKMMSGKKNPDAKFMMMAAMSDMNEISASNAAMSKSSNDDVKKMAEMMVADHTKSSEELKPIASSKGVMLPTEPDSKHKSAMEKMSSMSGMEFDMMYVKMMVKDHEKAVAMFQKEASSGKDADAKAFAAKTLPVLQGHLDMARSMMNKMMNMKSDNKMSGM